MKPKTDGSLILLIIILIVIVIFSFFLAFSGKAAADTARISPLREIVIGEYFEEDGLPVCTEKHHTSFLFYISERVNIGALTPHERARLYKNKIEGVCVLLSGRFYAADRYGTRIVETREGKITFHFIHITFAEADGYTFTRIPMVLRTEREVSRPAVFARYEPEDVRWQW